MQSNSVGYILGFCAAVCLVCSVIVSGTAVGLKEKQDINKRLDRQKKVLTVAGLIKEKQAVTPEQVESIFTKRIKQVVVDLQKGAIDKKATEKAADFDQQKAKADPKTSRKAPKNFAGINRLPNKALVFLVSKTDMKKDGSGFSLSQYIFPVEGKGLWSTLYGFVALAPDFNEIKGLTFYQHAETPGLGGEVDNPSWKAKWPKRMAFGPKGSHPKTWKNAKIQVMKGLAGSPAKDPYRVDGLSGATITSNGVTYLVQFWLNKHGFGPFIKNNVGKALDVQPAKRAKAPVRRAVKRAQPVKRRATAPRAASRPAPVRRAEPAKRTEPAKREVVPVKREAAPVKRAEPAKREAAPVKRAAAPAKPEVAPAKREAAPVKRVEPAKRAPVAPAKKAEPAKREAAPAKREAAPAKREAAPAKRAAAPAKAAPVKRAEPAKRAAPAKTAPVKAAPAKRAAAPVKPSAPVKRAAPAAPAKRVAPKKAPGGKK